MREQAEMNKDYENKIAKLKLEHGKLERQVKEREDLYNYNIMLAEKWTPTTNHVPTSPQTQNNATITQPRNVTPINSPTKTPTMVMNPYAKQTNTYATKTPPATVQPTGGSSAIFNATQYDKDSAVNAPPPKVHEKQQEKHEDAAKDLNELFDNSHNEQEEEDMVLATMNSSEKAEYMWEKYGKEEENDEDYFLTDGHCNGKEWQNEEAELEAKAEHDKKTAFASQDPTKSTVAADVTTAGRKRTRKPTRKVQEMEEAASKQVYIKQEKDEQLKNLV
jgi:hypothetical protein